MVHSQPMIRLKSRVQIRSLLARQCLAEFLSVFVLMFLTQGAVAQTVTSRGAKGNFFTSFLAGALAVTAAIYVGGNVSDALQNYTGGNLTVTGPQETASIFATYPASYLSLTGGFLDQVLGTWILLVGVLALLDLKNKGVPAGLEPVAVGLLILAIELAMGSNCGVPLNPARDLGPRLFTYVAGWGPEVFSAGNGWWWVPVVAPMVGATLGTATYQLLVALHHPEDEEPAQDLEFAQQKAPYLETPDSAKKPESKL
ncbi:Aquaporin-10 [Pteropus alecto]|uniref:Aquaporin-10 n=1 Tax=Pteropus alecto TaxID=9402 RepID=L5JU25_PTEAL|nr:Aquaporin-10 [Pteropus alecto]